MLQDRKDKMRAVLVKEKIAESCQEVDLRGYPDGVAELAVAGSEVAGHADRGEWDHGCFANSAAHCVLRRI